MRYVLIYVHLGDNPAPTLNHFSSLARNQELWEELLLVTDKPENNRNFPGRVIAYSRSRADPRLKKVLSSHKVRDRVAGGFWNYSLERIFALGEAAKVSGNSSIIHVESDVYLATTRDHLQVLSQRVVRTAVPRHGTDLATAAVLISPSGIRLLNDLDRLLDLLSQISLTTRGFVSDMELLGRALSEDILQELPTSVELAWPLSASGLGNRLVFDAASLGQYLFGVDPIHNRGLRFSGYMNPRAPVNLSSCSWRIRQPAGEGPVIEISTNGLVLELANLHVHSKELIPTLDPVNDRWRRALNEANRECERLTSGPFPLSSSHFRMSVFDTLRMSRGTSLQNQLKNSLKSGRLKLLRRAIKRLIR